MNDLPISGTLKLLADGAEGERTFHGTIITASIIITNKTVKIEFI